MVCFKIVVVSALLLSSGCYPTTPSSDCAEQISECLKSCENRPIEKNDYSTTPSSQRVTASPCEQTCYNRCGASISTIPAQPPVTVTPTAATPAPMPQPVPPPLEPALQPLPSTELEGGNGNNGN
jgi:hypothetical protein